MQIKKYGLVSIFLTLSLSNVGSAGTVGTYRVSDNEIISVQGSVGIFKVVVPKETLASILDVAKTGDTVMLADSEWTVTGSTKSGITLPLVDKNDLAIKADVVSDDTK